MNKSKLKTVAFICALFAGILLRAQKGTILLYNPSFEDQPTHSRTPIEWIDCGFPGESEPDIQPSGDFGVTMLAQDGDTYLGMVVRDNSTWERVTQRLSVPMKQGQCYEFSIYLAKSPQYLSTSRFTGEKANYIRNVKLRIYGGFSACKPKQLLAESPPISNYKWLQYTFTLAPNEDYTFITFEAFYQNDLFPYNGNILLDNASALIPTSCDENKITIVNDSSSTMKILPPSDEKSITLSTITLPPAPKFVKGELLQPKAAIKFATGTSELQRSGYTNLDKLIETLSLNPTLIVEINVYLSDKYDKTDAEDLSVQRAVTIERYLLDKMVNKNRFKVKAFGNSQAPNSSEPINGGAERVEIKVFDF